MDISNNDNFNAAVDLLAGSEEFVLIGRVKGSHGADTWKYVTSAACDTAYGLCSFGAELILASMEGFDDDEEGRDDE